MRRVLIGSALSLGLLVMAPAAHAAVAYTVTPAFQTEVLGTEAAADVSIQLTNHTTTDQSFKLSAADFGSLNESGGVAFLGSDPGDLNRPYGLISWLELGTNVVFVPAGTTVTVHASVQNRDSLAPGGHYGAILATAVTDTGAPQVVSPQVGLHAVLSSLILLTKSGGAKPELKLVSEDFSRQAFTLPTVIDQRFQDPGNLHVVPRGTTVITDPLGRVVARGALNEDSDVILPESFRRIPVNLSWVGHAWLPGRYKIITQYRFDGTDTILTFNDSTWYVGKAAVIAAWVIIGLGILFGGYLLWRRKRRQKV